METGLTLLFNAHMPLKYWADAFLTAIYLINRVSVRSVESVSPWQMLFKQEHNYSISRIFRCACYPWLRPHKLDARTKKCIMLDYSLNHKGYRCLDVSTGKIYLSRHVIFDENSFPFANSSSSSPPSPNTSSNPADVLFSFPLSVSICSTSWFFPVVHTWFRSYN